MDRIQESLFGNDSKIRKILEDSRTLGVSKISVLINGESGVGKRSLARYIHDNSNRIDKNCSIVDCNKNDQQVENLILGFRDSETSKFTPGVFESSNGGTVIFSNIDGLSEDFQKRLYNILLELDDYGLDLRIISTTYKNLSKLVASGRFYRGLYTLICGHVITIPPLRDRNLDAVFIAEEILKNICETQGLTLSLDESAKNKILNQPWTHNIEEIKFSLENTVGEVAGNSITEADLTLGRKRKSKNSPGDDEEMELMSLKEAERILIKKALVHTSENRTQAAKILGVSIRTLRNKINEYRSSGNSYFVNLR